MQFPVRRCSPPLPLLWRVFLISAAMLTIATLALAFSPATVSFPIALTEGLMLGAGVATLVLHLLMLRRVCGSALAPAGAVQEVGARHQPLAVTPPPVDNQAAARSRLQQQTAVGPEHAAGTRVLLGWSGPYRLSAADAEAWVEEELTRVLAAAGPNHARLTGLSSASVRYSGPLDWLLELHVGVGGDAEICLESPAWCEWLCDLRQIGMRPAAMVAASGRRLTGEER